MSLPETFGEKAWRKTVEQPLVPVGALLTVGFLLSGFKAFRNGQVQKSQVLMRGRVAAQAFTVIAMGVGAYMGMKPNAGPKTMEEKMERRDAADKADSVTK